MGGIIALVGCPAVGKSFLADKLSNSLDCRLIRELPEKGLPLDIMNNLSEQKNLFDTIVYFRNLQVLNYKHALSFAANNKYVVLDTPFYQNQLYVDLYVKDKAKASILRQLGEIDFLTYPQPDCTVYIKSSADEMLNFLHSRQSKNTWEDESWYEFITKMVPLADDYMKSIIKRIPNLILIQRQDYDFAKPEHVNEVISKIKKMI
ncbi:MAG: deoxynucleoside kinase [Candidatus Nanoarchaeia archaeon]|jgi:deoxyadenosine/deoxycytidine kinase